MQEKTNKNKFRISVFALSFLLLLSIVGNGVLGYKLLSNESDSEIEENNSAAVTELNSIKADMNKAVSLSLDSTKLTKVADDSEVTTSSILVLGDVVVLTVNINAVNTSSIAKGYSIAIDIDNCKVMSGESYIGYMVNVEKSDFKKSETDVKLQKEFYVGANKASTQNIQFAFAVVDVDKITISIKGNGTELDKKTISVEGI